MERRTIGGFIAALRKANGMTQRDLAERLHVSDKTVSRWERDDGAPDLSAIPVLAEIFGVTCDELLRGERKPASERIYGAEANEGTVKGEKQRQRILAVSLSKYNARTFIAIGLAMVGLIAAMIGNLGFLRAYIGFFAGAVFYLASVVCQAVFINSAFLSVAGDGLGGAETGRFKRAVVRGAERSIGLTAVLLGVSLPLAVLPNDAYVGLSAEAWFLYGGLFGAIALLLAGAVCYFLNARLLRRGVYSLGEGEERAYWANHGLKRRLALSLLAVMAVTLVFQWFVNSRWDAFALSEGLVFHDYDSFAAYMEQDVAYRYSDGYSSSAMEQVWPRTYYDEFGNEITEEEALRQELRVSDGTEEGRVVCEYIARNETVCSIRYTERDGSLLPITVITYDDLRVGQLKSNLINAAFAVCYGLELAAAVVLYGKRRAR